MLAARGEAAGVEGEMGVPAFVLAEGASVEPHARLPVDAAEAQERPLLPVVRHAKRSPVADALVYLAGRADPGERRLERERHADLAPRLARLELHLPGAVEARPRVARELWERVVRQGFGASCALQVGPSTTGLPSVQSSRSIHSCRFA